MDSPRQILRRAFSRRTAIAVAVLALAAGAARAEPWLPVGDPTLRSDVEILAAHGLIDNLVTTWPIPAGQMSQLNNEQLIARQPEFVRMAAARVLSKLLRDGKPRGLEQEVGLRLTNEPDTVRDFGTAARSYVTGQAGLIWDAEQFGAALKLSDQPRLDGSHEGPALDGSYFSLLLDNWQLYGGWVDQWYGPGWTSSMTLSNNARPVPKLGIMRNNPHAFDTPWLSWIGPWQFNTFIGVLDGPRIDTNTLYLGVRFTFEPIHGLELGLARTSEACGRHHRCRAFDEFHFTNSDSNPNPVNDEATMDVKYTRSIGILSVSPYAQLMNEDTGPFVHSATSYLIGSSMTAPWGSDGAHWRVTAEYADSVATLNWFDFGKKTYGAAYTDYKYIDGDRYRGRTLGFSLDSDSRLFSLAAALTSARAWTYRLVYYRATINTPQTAASQQAGSPYLRNSVSTQPVQFNEIEAALSVPLRPWTFDLSVRGQDAQAYPKPGGKVSAELAVGYRF